MAIVFPGQGDPDPESVAVSIAQATFMNYAFVIMPDRYMKSSSMNSVIFCIHNRISIV